MGGSKFDWAMLRVCIVLGILTALVTVGYGINLLVRWIF